MSREQRIITAIKNAAKALDKSVNEVTMQDLIRIGEVTQWDIKMLGGFSSIKKAAFATDGKELGTIAKFKETNSYITKLERVVGKSQNLEEQLKEAIAKTIKPIKLSKYKGPKTSKSKLERELVVSINDVHYGLIVDPEEVGGVNKYSWTEACRRTALLAKQVAEYKIEKRAETKRLHVIINGDLLQGIIHDLTARTAELMVHQVNGATHILAHFIDYVSQHFENIVVHGVSGNHDDMPHRREGGRVTSHKYDSFANMVYYSLSAAFKGNKNISFNFPKDLLATVQLPGGKMLVTHGDTLFGRELGNPSTSLNIKGLSNVIARFNTGEIEKGEDKFKMVLMGHVHNHVNFTTFDGVKVVVAPCMSGIDPYARSLSFNVNEIGQVIFESTKDHIYGDPRVVSLKAADNDKSLDKIIPTFKNELKFT
jgi:hypothetical protein